MAKLDQASIEEYGLLLLKLKLFPYFDMANYIIMCLAVRDDIHLYNTVTPNFHKRHPFSCYFSSMLNCFGGGMMVHFLLGEPILDDFKTHQSLVLATLAWYLVFFSPFDIFYKLVKFLPVKMVICCCKELVRCRKIYDGVNHAMHIYPNSYVIIVIVGAMKGAGTGFVVLFDRLYRGVWLPNTSETLHPSVPSKSSFVAAILFILQRKEFISVPRNLLFFFVVVFFAYCKLMSIFFKSFDPFFPFENLTAAVFFGGIIDALRKATQANKPVSRVANTNASGGSGGTGTAGSSESSKLQANDADLKKTN